MLELPAILNIPKKLIPLITDFNNYTYFLLEGGRGGGKSWAVAQLIIYLCCVRKIRVGCGREVQKSIEDSVYQLLVDVINRHHLQDEFDITQNKIKHKVTGSTVKFFGLREHGSVNIKSLEGIDLFWGEEAQSITKYTLEVLLPTIRKHKSRCIFTMNRFIRKDAVYVEMSTNPKCLHLSINYYENEFCPQSLADQAERAKLKNPKDYPHVWLGEPLATTVDYLFNFDKLAKLEENIPFGSYSHKQRVMSVDFAAGGGDLCVASILERKSITHWELIDQKVWADPDTDNSVGKTISIYGDYQPNILIVDACGLGLPMYNSIAKTIPDAIAFNGAETNKCSPAAANNRAEAYICTKTYVDNEDFTCKDKETIQELETIKKVHQKNGKIIMLSKVDMRKQGVESPDRADSVSMAFFAIVHYLGKVTVANPHRCKPPTRVNNRKKIGRR